MYSNTVKSLSRMFTLFFMRYSSYMTSYRKVDLEPLQINPVNYSVCDFRWFNTKSHSRRSTLENMAVENFSGRTHWDTVW